jgi:hypothetical protein
MISVRVSQANSSALSPGMPSSDRQWPMTAIKVWPVADTVFPAGRGRLTAIGQLIDGSWQTLT